MNRRHGRARATLERDWSQWRCAFVRFVEIPVRDSITTIVGANESGKSHLLSAISKVIRGAGIPRSTGVPLQRNGSLPLLVGQGQKCGGLAQHRPGVFRMHR